MNNILELKGKRFIQASRQGGGGGASMNGHVIVTSEHIKVLIEQLKSISDFWYKEKRPFKSVIISVHYNKIVAKSNRIAGLFKGKDSNYSVVGAKFNDAKNKHIITYCLDSSDIDKSIDLLENANLLLNKYFAGNMNKTTHENKERKKDNFPSSMFKNSSIHKSIFRQVIADLSYIERFSIEMPDAVTDNSIITIYDVGMNLQDVLRNIGIDVLGTRILDSRSVYLDSNQLTVLLDKMPYLVAMATTDLSNLVIDSHSEHSDMGLITIPKPTIEPTIGVIDTLFDKKVYFSDWVEYYDEVAPEITRSTADYNHGTAVSSIIVDGPRLNPWLEDNCGRFKVRHFGVAVGASFSSFSIIKQIQSIVQQNLDIKVWNISLGSHQEINDNYISTEAALLDQIQYENDVIFIIAGTNKSNYAISKIGSPADSINSIVVNSVTRSGKVPAYGRKGLALSFFSKPDVSYYGGSREEYINVCEPLGQSSVAGTSYAAPWIARKMAYLIHILGLNREVAKALIIDSARSWNTTPTVDELAVYGHGIVPIDINEIINTSDDEIRFLVSDISEKWNTYNYNFPVPIKNDIYPYIARATMCYFPMCNKSQGVDYTNTELNIHFGRIDKSGKVRDIKGDTQYKEANDGALHYILEEEARKQFRKWDNVKYIAESVNKRFVGKSTFGKTQWGMEVKTNNRLNPKDGKGIRFGVVVTLKEINNVNRIDEFIKNCHLSGWLVNVIDATARVDIQQKLNEEIVF